MHDAFHVVETKKVGVCFMDKEVGVCIFIGCRVLIFLLQWKEIKSKMQICSFNWGLMVGITFPDIHKAYYTFM